MTHWLIRRARSMDMVPAVALWNQTLPFVEWADPDEQISLTGGFLEILEASIIFVAEQVGGHADGQMVGAVVARLMRDDPTQAQVGMLVVSVEAMRRGLGTSLVRELSDCLQSMGCLALRLNVHHANAAARALYEHEGWRHDGETEAEELIYRYQFNAGPASGSLED